MSVLLLVDMFGKVALMFLFEPTCFHVGVFLLGLCHPHPGGGAVADQPPVLGLLQHLPRWLCQGLGEPWGRRGMGRRRVTGTKALPSTGPH